MITFNDYLIIIETKILYAYIILYYWDFWK